MGSVADKIAKKILSSRGSKVVDLAAWREGRKMALEAGFGDDGSALGKLAGHDPCHAPYIVGQNFASLMAESISGMREAKGFTGGHGPLDRIGEKHASRDRRSAAVCRSVRAGYRKNDRPGSRGRRRCGSCRSPTYG